MLDWKHYKKTLSKAMFWKDLLPLWQKTCKFTVCLTGNIGKNTVKNNVLEGFLIYIYIYVGVWLPALEHGKIEENTVNSGIFNGWGNKGIGSIVEHDVFRPVFMATKV